MSDCPREAAIRELLPLVKRIARRLRRLVYSLDVDDLIGDGCVGLIRAVDSYDARRGPALETYARRLVIGAMLNGIRRMDPVSERARRLVRDGENQRYALAAVRGEVPSLAEMEGRLPGYVRALSAAHWGVPLSLDAPLPKGEALADDPLGDPAGIFERRADRTVLAWQIVKLPERLREVVVRHYIHGASLRAVGRRLAISPQRASQLHLAAIAKLRRGIHAAPH